VVARIAPLDLPQLVRSFLASAAPRRLDIVETEIWPHLILESRRRSVAVVFVSAAVSERTRRRLLRWGLAGRALFGEGVWVLAQSERHAERFRSLGVPPSGIAVTGDLKAERPQAAATRDQAERPTVVFGSLRPGEEEVAVGLARSLAHPGARPLVVAPRHKDGMERVLGALRASAVPISIRQEEDRAREDLSDWIDRLKSASPPRVGILATLGELPLAYESAGVAIVGGTFAPYGGHNVLEPAARGCAVVVGPYSDAVQEGVEALAREHAILEVKDAAAASEGVRTLLDTPEAMRRMGEGAVRAAEVASRSAALSLEALGRFGLTP
jgi:3-deoxy-D-manno-octulosonic-acid transferase